ncbi:Crp/Fnr family transcriptional regulator [Sphingobacterium tabacisoli]|uniref:Crp/Fnr family transcriptional regulator n=1 Tax=Sphingobacterium tabacisoli TaxID=2044855 RepID=A0ABW5L024_9SPHI|nr:Crp/Fnr family transcriptional regulator [Sphingobacterium tabacisoli]
MKKATDLPIKICYEILHFFNKIHRVSPGAADYLLANTKYITIRKGKFLRSPIDQEDVVYFIVKGLIRGFIRDEGKDITTWINEESNIVGSIRNMGLDEETDEYLQALEDSVVIEIHRSSLEYLYDKFYEANIIGRKILEIYYRDAEERAYLCRLPTAEKRYKRFINTRPALTGRVSLKYLASYLGMKEETLCRVRAKYQRPVKC